MYAITGVTGQVGSATASALLHAGKAVRAVVRNPEKASGLVAQGCELAVADLSDTASLTKAFHDVEAVFILMPPNFDPSVDFMEDRALIASVKAALLAARPPKIVCLSTIGAESMRHNLLRSRGLMEEAMRSLDTPITFLRAAWFMENFLWDVEPAKQVGRIPSFLQPLDKPISMVATQDIGFVASQLLQESWTGTRVVELEGPRKLSPNDVAASFSRVMCKEIKAQIVARPTWPELFLSQGMKNPRPRIEMLDGFNEGWIDFVAGAADHRKGTTDIDTVIASLVGKNQ